MSQLPTKNLSEKEFRSLQNQIENKLLTSEVCQSTVATLQKLEDIRTANNLIEAVAQEAIRLTFEQIAQRGQILAAAMDGESSSDYDKYPQNDQNATLSDSLPERLQRPIGATIPITSQRSKADKRAAQMNNQEREEKFQKIGSTLRQARQTKSLSVRQLNNQTLVPIHQIEAIEAGIVCDPEEDIYIRGFIRRIGNALGLNGVDLAASLPKPHGNSLIPSWNSAKSNSGIEIKLAHLYLGYTAIVAGSLGGLAWLGNQGAPSISSIEPETPVVQEDSLSSAQYADNATTTSTTPSNVAPPENMPQ